MKDTLLNLGTDTSPGTGGMRFGRTEAWPDFSMLYLTGTLPPWFYKVWGGVTTVSLFKTRERQSLRPVGVMTPLIRTLHSHVIIENRVALTKFL